jgi:excisionase family DNA binding protein
MPRYAAVRQLLFSPRQCARILGCSVSLIRKFIRDNRLTSVRLGSNSKIPRSEVLRLVRDGTASPNRPRRKTGVQP